MPASRRPTGPVDGATGSATCAFLFESLSAARSARDRCGTCNGLRRGGAPGPASGTGLTREVRVSDEQATSNDGQQGEEAASVAASPTAGEGPDPATGAGEQ